MRKRIYVSGPITKGDLRRNIKQATDAGIRLLRLGYAPLVPHLTCYMSGDAPEVLPCGTVHEDWYDSDFSWVAVSHAVLRLPGESDGADRETSLARNFGIPVFDSIDDLVKTVPAD
jgi:hypothetical protein